MQPKTPITKVKASLKMKNYCFLYSHSTEKPSLQTLVTNMQMRSSDEVGLCGPRGCFESRQTSSHTGAGTQWQRCRANQDTARAEDQLPTSTIAVQSRDTVSKTKNQSRYDEGKDACHLARQLPINPWNLHGRREISCPDLHTHCETLRPTYTR